LMGTLMTGLSISLKREWVKDASRVHHEADVIAHSIQCRELLAISSNSKQSVITKEILAQRWFTGLEAAGQTLQATTQEGMRFVEGPIERRLRTSQAHMRFPSLIMNLCSDTLFSHVRSIHGYTCVQVFTDGHGFVRVYPMKSKGDAHHALMHFIHEVVSLRTFLQIERKKKCVANGDKSSRNIGFD
jgi:hypothetical protein